MRIFKLKKGEKVRVRIEKSTNNLGKTQLNARIDGELKNRVKRMAKICRIPISGFVEHCIEVGMHYIEQTMKDEKKRKILEEHLEKKHLLNNKTDNEETIVRISENNVNWLLLDGVEGMLDKMLLLNRQALEAGLRKNFKSVDSYRAELFREMVTFLNRITELSEREKYQY